MEHKTNQSNLIDEHTAALVLDLKVSTLRRWRWSGDGPLFVKLGGAVLYDPCDLDNFINERRCNSTTENVD